MRRAGWCLALCLTGLVLRASADWTVTSGSRGSQRIVKGEGEGDCAKDVPTILSWFLKSIIALGFGCVLT